MADRELMQMALDALEEAQDYTSCPTYSPSMTQQCATAAVALRARLAQPEPEPVAWEIYLVPPPLYPAPPQREWQGLTDEEMQEAMDYWSDSSRSAYGGAWSATGEYVDVVETWRYIEAKLKEKNR